MELELWRYRGGPDATLGMLMLAGSTWEQLCFTCEDEHRDTKVAGETRIPAGRYQILFRKSSPMALRYKASMGPVMRHPGMLWLQDVPGFTFVYLHIGNDDDDTEGCPLVGEKTCEALFTVEQSRTAYKRIYPRIAAAIENGRGCWITIRDLDRSTLPHP